MGKTPDLGREAEALRQLTQDAHGAAKDLRAAIAEARKTGPAIVKEYLEKAVAEGLAEYGESIQKAMSAAVAKVNGEFDKLSDILMGRTAEDKAEGKRSIPELVHEMTRPAETVADPRRLGGNIAGPGGPHDRGQTVFDTRNAVLLDYCEVATAEKASDGTPDAITLLLAGKVNGSRDRAKILYIMDEDGAAALVTEIEALTRRGARDGWAERYAKAKAQREMQMRADGTWE